MIATTIIGVESVCSDTVPQVFVSERFRVEGRTLVFVRVERWQDLVRGRFDLLEPPSGGTAVSLEAEDAVVVPGVAFDARGWRLGRGGGYYDRTFPPGRPGPLLIGAAFTRQRVEEVPHDSHDRSMDAIVTEDGLEWTSQDQR